MEVLVTQKLNLQPYKTQGMGSVRCGTEIRCLEGMLWITQEGDLIDHIIERGDKFVVDRKGKVVLQGMNLPSTFSLN
jgi:hypothetical protein